MVKADVLRWVDEEEENDPILNILDRRDEPLNPIDPQRDANIDELIRRQVLGLHNNDLEDPGVNERAGVNPERR